MKPVTQIVLPNGERYKVAFENPNAELTEDYLIDEDGCKYIKF